MAGNMGPITMQLTNEDVWAKFHSVVNEMVITKNGRRMFPIVEVLINGLEDNSMYSLEMEFVSSSDSRLRFHDGKWMPSPTIDAPTRRATYRHPESPNYGSHWMKYAVSFSKVKMTNKQDSKEFAVLSSHHRYYLKIHVYKAEMSDQAKQVEKLVQSFAFPVTEFITVTAYQNQEVTALKIDHNPFAKAFKGNRWKEREDQERISPEAETLCPENRIVTPQGSVMPYRDMMTSSVHSSVPVNTWAAYNSQSHYRPNIPGTRTEHKPFVDSCMYNGYGGYYSSPYTTGWPAPRETDGYTFPYQTNQRYILPTDFGMWETNVSDYVPLHLDTPPSSSPMHATRQFSPVDRKPSTTNGLSSSPTSSSEAATNYTTVTPPWHPPENQQQSIPNSIYASVYV